MANLDEVQKLKVDQLKELAAQHNIEVVESDKKEDLVLKVSDGITPEQLEEYVGGSADSEDSSDSDAPEVTPVSPEKAAEDSSNEAQVQARVDDTKVVNTKLGSSKEESAAARAGVGEENLENARQNREPKNQFEKENQKVTEQERKAAQKESDVKAKEHGANAPTPNETAAADAEQSAATNQGNEIASAIAAGFKRAADGRDNFELMPEEGVEPRFTLVRNKQTGEVLLRDNGDGTLSQIQLKSLEEKENDLQGTEVEEL